MTKTKKIGVVIVALLAVIAVLAGVTIKRILHPLRGEQTGQSSQGILGSLGDLGQIVSSPREGFPGKSRVTLLCMGIDDNWTDKDEVYTAGSRTDTLFLLTLDLDAKKATMLSIPRDTYVHIAGTHHAFKINQAYETGGPDRAIQTVAGLLGVTADHYLVLNVNSTQRMVDALGGVDVDVPHEMHYHDKWGHLSIDLKPGEQHLDGQQAVGFARYRHPDAGHKSTPEDGDERRMARQHILMRAMIDRGKSFANVTQAPHLIDVGMSTIRTDLTRTQLFDLAALFRGVQQDDIRTASIPGDDFRGPNGEWFYRLDMKQAHALTDWLVKGDEGASRHLVPVIVRNGTKVPGLAGRVVAQLQAAGFTDVTNGGNATAPKVQLASTSVTGEGGQPRTTLLDTGVVVPQAAADVASALALPNAFSQRIPNKPNKAGWTAPATLTVILGQDYAQALKAAGLLTVQSGTSQN